MNTLSRRCVKPSSGTTDLNTKSSEMLVTRKGPKTKFHQMIRSKTKVKGTSENANKKESRARILTPDKERIQGAEHTGVRTVEGVSWPPMRHHKLVSFSSYLSPKPLGLSHVLVLSPGPKCPRECPLAAPARLGQPPARFPESPAQASVAGGGPPSASPGAASKGQAASACAISPGFLHFLHQMFAYAVVFHLFFCINGNSSV